jgi:hypothetical protein
MTSILQTDVKIISQYAHSLKLFWCAQATPTNPKMFQLVAGYQQLSSGSGLFTKTQLNHIIDMPCVLMSEGLNANKCCYYLLTVAEMRPPQLNLDLVHQELQRSAVTLLKGQDALNPVKLEQQTKLINKSSSQHM